MAVLSIESLVTSMAMLLMEFVASVAEDVPVQPAVETPSAKASAEGRALTSLDWLACSASAGAAPSEG